MVADAAFVPCAEEGIRQMPPLLITVRLVVGADGEQPGEFALAAGVRLDRYLGVAGEFGQPGFKHLDQAR